LILAERCSFGRDRVYGVGHGGWLRSPVIGTYENDAREALRDEGGLD
jgi:hypothetical protein